jgi:hypothetical protein
MRCKGVDWMQLLVITVYWRAVVNTAMNASVQQEVKNIFNS